MNFQCFNGAAQRKIQAAPSGCSVYEKGYSLTAKQACTITNLSLPACLPAALTEVHAMKRQ